MTTSDTRQTRAIEHPSLVAGFTMVRMIHFVAASLIGQAFPALA